jgi:hypothetical protein
MFNDEESPFGEAFDERTVSITDFEADLSAADWVAKYRVGDLITGPIFWAPIETLAPTRTVGKGRTNLTLIRPTILQTDAATPYAGFDRRESPTRNPAVSVHFAPAAYGITGVGTYVFVFAVEAFTRSEFRPSGFAGGGTVDAPGAIRFSGKRVITVILRNVPAAAGAWAAIEQTDGESWSWFSTRISHPPLVLDALQANG